MNFEIIPRQVNGDTIQTVSARELHAELKVGRDFSTWVKRRIEQYGFEEGVDFCSFLSESTRYSHGNECAFDSPIQGNQTSGRGGDRRSIEYHISLDMAKELAMVENNDQGRAARRYFIECERKLKAPAQNQLQPIEQAKPTAEAVGVICDILRLPDSGKIAMLKSAMSPWPLISNAIPSYSHDAPVSTSGIAPASAVSTLPISKIVEGWLTARTANAALEKAGLITTVERVKRGGSIATFKSVTEKGLAYGKNVIDFRNPRETNPHWFIETSEALKEIIKQHL